MKKTKSSIGSIIVVGFLIYPFVWIFDTFGWIGIGLIAASITCFVVVSRAGNGNQKEFDRQVLHFLKDRYELAEAKKVNLQLARSNFQKAELVRNIQIINDSIDVALSSKKRDVAESRMQLALKLHQEIKNKHAGLVSSDVSAEIDRIVEEAAEAFRTKLYVNVSAGYIEKVEKLKTLKSKQKYIDMAIDTLKEGLANRDGDTHLLSSEMSKVERLKESLVSS